MPQQVLNSRVAGLKKRDGRKSNKRPKSWVESMQEKAKKKDKKQAKSTQGKSMKGAIQKDSGIVWCQSNLAGS